VIEPGAFIPCDGVVLDGASEIQDPAGADDVFPILVKAGARVHTGARNGDGVLTIQSSGTGLGSAKIVAQRRTDRVQWIVDAAACLMLVTAGGMAAWRYVHPVAGHDAIADSLRLLMMATPLGMGLVLAAPASEVLNAALRLGIEIRDIAILDRLRRVRAIVIGHRGVLVPDRLRVISAQCVEGLSGSDLIKRVAAVAQLGHEPWGKAVLDFAVGFRMRLRSATDYKTSLGEGIMALIDGQQTIVGTREFVESRGVSCMPLNEAAKVAIGQGRRLRWVGEATPSRRVIGFISFGAPTLAGAAEATKNLHRLGLKTAWLAQTDDPAHLALAKHLKIDRVISERSEDVVDGLANVRNKFGPILLVTADVVPDGLVAGDVVLPFGQRIVEQLPGSALATARHDPRLIVDLLSLAARHRQVALTNAVIAFATAIVFAFFPKLLGVHSDLASYEVAIVLLLAMSSLGVRAAPTTADEIDEE
jgi:Cu+-exporting ATPase